jgi:hypothetical protein
MGPRIPDGRKLKAIQDVEAGLKSAREIYAEYGIQATQFKAWKAKFGSSISVGDNGVPIIPQSQVNELLQEVEALKAENQQLREMYMDLLLRQRKGGEFPEKKNSSHTNHSPSQLKG